MSAALQEATQFKSLSAWFDNFGAQAAYFSSSTLRSADNRAQANEAAPEGKNARTEAEMDEAGEEGEEKELLSSAEDEQPYAELSRKEMLEVLSEKDKALNSSSDRVSNNGVSMLVTPGLLYKSCTRRGTVFYSRTSCRLRN